MSAISSPWAKRLANAMFLGSVTQRQIDINDQFERNINKIEACTGKKRDEIISFVTGSPNTYDDIADFSAGFGRFPDLAEQKQLASIGMHAFEHNPKKISPEDFPKLSEYILKNASR